MKFKIDFNQSVSVNEHGDVHFYHHSNSESSHVLSLTYHNFLNFNDIIYEMDQFPRLVMFPIGEGIYLLKRNGFVELHDNYKQIFFRFYHRGWKEYKYNVHYYILSFLHDDSHTPHHKSHEGDECLPKDTPRRPLSIIQRPVQILSRSSRNVTDENGKQSKKRANISRREGSTPGSHLRRASRKHARRVLEKIEEAKEDEELSTVTSENKEYGCEPNVAISD